VPDGKATWLLFYVDCMLVMLDWLGQVLRAGSAFFFVVFFLADVGVLLGSRWFTVLSIMSVFSARPSRLMRF
jgi:hypothetical protein